MRNAEWTDGVSPLRTPHSALPTRKGFSLLELMLSLVIFTVGTVAVMELMHRGQAGATDGENVLIATHLAQRRLEELHTTSFSQLADEAKTSVTSPTGFTRFSREVVVTSPDPLLKQLVVTVFWSAPGGEVNVSIQTYRSAS